MASLALIEKCSKCEKKAVARLRHYKLRLCEEHLLEFIRNRVSKTIKKYGMLGKTGVAILALSGGKDSIVLGHILSSMLSEFSGLEIIGFHVDLGIGDYSRMSREVVASFCRDHGLKCILVSLEESIGITLPELARRARRPPCSVCGLVKRYYLNAVAVEARANCVILGHHLDDMVVYALKSILTRGLEGLEKLGPLTPTLSEVLVGRIRPLYEVYESDIVEYARVAGLRYVSQDCPLAPRRAIIEQALRDMLESIERRVPGFKIQLAKNLARMALSLKTGLEETRKCQICSLPSSSDVCSFCRLTRKTIGEPMGVKIRDYVRKAIESATHSGSRNPLSHGH